MVDDNPKKPITGLPAPMGLPEPQPRTEGTEELNLHNNIDRARNCPKCGREGRVVSNDCGVNVFCGPCKIHWPIANSSLQPELPVAFPRGFHKETRVEPDWSIAFDHDLGDT